MPFSDDIENVLDFLDQAAGNGLLKRNDLGTLLELAAERGAHEEMNELIFHGRHLHGLYRTLRRTTPGAEGFTVLEREFATSVETVRERLAHLLIDARTEQVERFEIHYYATTQGGLRNLVDLAHDLGVLKSVQNDRKHGAPDAGTGLEGDNDL